MAAKRKRLTATAALMQAIGESGLAFIELERRSGVKRQSIMKFVRGEQSLRLDLADKLMAVLGVSVQLGPIPPLPKPRRPQARNTKRAGL